MQTKHDWHSFTQKEELEVPMQIVEYFDDWNTQSPKLYCLLMISHKVNVSKWLAIGENRD